MKVTVCKDVRQHINRVKALKCMDYLVMHLDNELCEQPWLMCGLPDGWDDDDLHAIAEDDEQFDGVCKTFLNVMVSDEAYDGGFDL